MTADSVGEFVKSMNASYAGQVPSTVDPNDLIFVTKPGVGASVFNPLILEDNRMMENASPLILENRMMENALCRNP